MSRFIISAAAQADVVSILTWTHEVFGQQMRRRYEALLVRAIRDVAANPDRTGAQSRPEIDTELRTYHLWNSRNRVAATVGRVRYPRHFLIFRVRADGQIEIGRILHDSMDLAGHLPTGYTVDLNDEIESEDATE